MFYERHSSIVFNTNTQQIPLFDLNDSSKTELEQSMFKAGMAIRGRDIVYADKRDTERQLEIKIVKEKYDNKNLARIITNSISDKSNPINMMIAEFRNIFLHHYLNDIREFKSKMYDDYYHHTKKTKVTKIFLPKPPSQRCKNTKESLDSLQKFIKLMISCLNYIYAPIIGTEKFQGIKETLTNALIEVLINNEVYTVIFMFMRMEHEVEEEILKQRIADLGNANPEVFNISPYLSLSKAALTEKVLNTIKKNAENIDYTDDWLKYLNQHIEMNILPYKEAIDKLKPINLVNSPMEKIKVIVSLNSIICKAIDDFWKDIPVPKEKLTIDADQYLSILVYIVIKSNTKDMFTHICLSNEFATLGSTSSYNAYSLTTLQASFYHLLNLDMQNIDRNDNEELKENNIGTEISYTYNPSTSLLGNYSENSQDIGQP